MKRQRGLRTAAVLILALYLAQPALAQGRREAATAQYGLDLAAQGPEACSTTREPLAELVARKEFEALPVAARADILSGLLACYRDYAMRPLAYAVAARLEPIARTPEQVGSAHYYLVLRDRAAGKWSEAVDHLLKLADAAPELVDRYTVDFLNNLGPGADTARQKAYLRLLTQRTWRRDTWEGEYKFQMAQNRWSYLYARMLLADQDVAGARAVLKGVTEPTLLEDISKNPAFRSLWPEAAAAGPFDRDAVRAEALAVARRNAEAFPYTLAASTRAMRVMIKLDREQEAIDLGRALFARIEAGEAFTDTETQHAYVAGEIANAYAGLGQEEEALVWQRRAAASPYANVSQVLNLAGMLMEDERMDEALKVAERAETMSASPFGKMVRLWITTCASAKADPAKARQTLDLMRPRWSDHPTALTNAMVCLGSSREEAEAEVAKLRAAATTPGQ